MFVFIIWLGLSIACFAMISGEKFPGWAKAALYAMSIIPVTQAGIFVGMVIRKAILKGKTS